MPQGLEKIAECYASAVVQDLKKNAAGGVLSGLARAGRTGITTHVVPGLKNVLGLGAGVAAGAYAGKKLNDYVVGEDAGYPTASMILGGIAGASAPLWGPAAFSRFKNLAKRVTPDKVMSAYRAGKTDLKPILTKLDTGRYVAPVRKRLLDLAGKQGVDLSAVSRYALDKGIIDELRAAKKGIYKSDAFFRDLLSETSTGPNIDPHKAFEKFLQSKKGVKGDLLHRILNRVAPVTDQGSALSGNAALALPFALPAAGLAFLG